MAQNRQYFCLFLIAAMSSRPVFALRSPEIRFQVLVHECDLRDVLYEGRSESTDCNAVICLAISCGLRVRVEAMELGLYRSMSFAERNDVCFFELGTEGFQQQVCFRFNVHGLHLF